MPRQTVWINQQQLDEVRRIFGGAVNLSGVVRVAVGQLIDHAQTEDRAWLVDLTRLQSEMADSMDAAERVIGRAARARVERAVQR